MKKQLIYIGDIPAIIWGEPSEKVYIHVHGKMSRKEYAEQFAVIAEQKGYQTLSFDLPEHGERSDNHEYRCDVWNGMHDLSLISDYVFPKWDEVSLYACSLGAYFSLNTYAYKPFTKCLFQSPMVDMEHMIRLMFMWNGVTEEMLEKQNEIETSFETLRWDYFQYVLQHPIEKWDIPTAILYGGKDNLQTYEIVKGFADKHGCRLTVSENSEHPFMAQDDFEIVAGWLKENI